MNIVYGDLSTRKILTMEWVDGFRLSDKDAMSAAGLDASRFVDTLVKCSMKQMLDNGFFHAGEM
jgi:predicted unusual protein kinase regulating ubiquinone biosynthesis (AarF/ABC1/UbiB family)